MPDSPDPNHPDHPALITRNARYGMIMFIPYLVLYGGFVVLSAFDPALMARPLMGGVNIAVAYGMALIVAAFVFAVIYMVLCGARHRPGGDA